MLKKRLEYPLTISMNSKKTMVSYLKTVLSTLGLTAVLDQIKVHQLGRRAAVINEVGDCQMLQIVLDCTL